MDRKKDDRKTGKHIPKKHPEKALSPATIRNAKFGKYADGNGLYLRVEESGSKRWVLRTIIRGKRCELGLGSARLVSLAEAREEAIRLRKMARKGGDPLAQRRQERRIVPTFEAAAKEVHAARSATFKIKHAKRWLKALADYAFPVFGNRSIDSIQPADVLKVLSPIWNTKPETAQDVKQRINRVFQYAKAQGWFHGDNPVDGIKEALPPRVANGVRHHSALKYTEIPAFIESLREAKTAEPVKLAFEYTILTAARTSETILAKWPEIDLDAKTWTVPADRMKAKKEHRVPLSARCIEILKAAKELSTGGEYIFPGRSQNKPLSNMAFLMTLRRLEKTDITAHGFRSSFRDWAEEKTTAQRSVVEAALAHQVENKVEAAYLRTTLFEKRRRLMDSWAAYALQKPSQKVVKISEA